MTQQTNNNLETGLVVRGKINDNFSELFTRQFTYAITQDYPDASAAWTAAPTLATGGFWDDDTPSGRMFRFADRVFVGDAATEGGGAQFPGVEKSWVGFSASGFMTYFDSRSTMAVYSPIGAVGIAGASRSSDNDRAGELNTIGGGFYVNNDNTDGANKKSAWAIYGHAATDADNEFTAAMELDACTTTTAVGVTPFTMGVAGGVATAWLGVGGETAQGLVANGFGATLNNVSCAVGIVNTADSAAGNRYAKGIVFQSNAIAGTDGSTGTGIAIEMVKGHEISWMFSAGANAYAGKIRAESADSATHQRIVMGTGAFQVRGVQSDLTTEQPLFQIVAPTMGAAAVNYMSFSPALAGTGVTQVNAAGPDTNVDIQITPKGSGVLRLGYGTGAAVTPANFTADRLIAFKDSSGTTYFIPCKATGW